MIGGSLGSFFGPWGAVAGAAAGHFLVDRKAPSPQKQAQRLIAVTAASLYELARIDGRYTASEDRAIRTILAEINQAVGGALSPHELSFLIDDCARIDRPLARLAALVRDNPDLARASVVWLWRVAVSDGDETPAEVDYIASYARPAGLHEDDLRNTSLLYVRRSASAQERRDACHTLDIPYHADDAQIKSAYRALSLTYHPDRHSGLDPAIQALTAEKFAQIKAAYDTLRGRDSDDWFARDAAGQLVAATSGAMARCFICDERATLPTEARQIDSARCARCQTLLAFERDLATHLMS
ncbi:MAG TPA: DnaJ domain-containing protein [Kiritimatiellia bacterium]|nr:DnaJ domain-containing protein [Kiritimatiellia bacterium]HRU71084.1 DnaJ domain-containing protein [Kiritimatiellia bacterium]